MITYILISVFLYLVGLYPAYWFIKMEKFLSEKELIYLVVFSWPIAFLVKIAFTIFNKYKKITKYTSILLLIFTLSCRTIKPEKDNEQEPRYACIYRTTGKFITVLPDSLKTVQMINRVESLNKKP